MSEVVDVANRLNRLYKLYELAIQVARPYRLHKIRQAYQVLFGQASVDFHIIPLRSFPDYEMFLGPLPDLLPLLDRKHNALERQAYEEAAALRDQEKEYVRSMIQQSGRNKHDHFFPANEKIFFKEW